MQHVSMTNPLGSAEEYHKVLHIFRLHRRHLLSHMLCGLPNKTARAVISTTGLRALELPAVLQCPVDVTT